MIGHKITKQKQFFHRLQRQCLRSLTTKQQHQQHRQHQQDDPASRRSVLFLSPTSWPEPNATAAGTRTMSLLQHFSPACRSLQSSTSSSLFHSVHFGCGANLPKRYGEGNGGCNHIQWHHIKPNRSNDMTKLIQNIEAENGLIKAVVFDRFYAEEAYSFRIREECPNALRVLDMQDVHSLRVGRQYLVEQYDKSNLECAVDGKYPLFMTPQLMNDVMNFDPSSSSLLSQKNENKKDKQNRLKTHDTFLRELASVHRSDLVLVCSSEEMALLEHKWKIPRWKLVPASFFCSEQKNWNSESPSFDERTDFVTVGGFKHPPNVDSINVLRKLWPRIRARLPAARLHVYGAYPSARILSCHDETNGFLVHGHVEDLDGVLKKSRVLLAPLRFGAGIKGKIVDAWRCGCPVVTTPVGAEGMRDLLHDGDIRGTESWGGRIVKDETDFVIDAVRMYCEKPLWYECQENARLLLNGLFDRDKNLPIVDHAINHALVDIDDRRKSDLVGSLLWHQNHRSTEYFSRWIELKESKEEKCF
ncbi:hypothetical protein ACHAXS_002530 [Conticribra weissflogii]